MQTRPENTREAPFFRESRLVSKLTTAALLTLMIPSLLKAAVPDAEAGLVIPGLTGALTENALAPRENPAGLGFMEGSELWLSYLRADGARNTGLHYGSRLGLLALGFGQEWLDGEDIGRQRRTQLSFALGERSFSLGGSVRWLTLAGSDEAIASYDVGIAGRAHPWFSWSFRARDLGYTDRTSYAAGLGLRALGDRLTLGVDRIWRHEENFLDMDGLLSWAIGVRLYHGILMSGQVLHPLTGGDPEDVRLQLAITLDLPTAGATVGHVPAGTLRDNAYAAMRLSTARYRSPIVVSEQVLLNLEEMLSPADRRLIPSPRRDPFIDIIRLLDQARRDPEIDAVIIRTSGRAMLSFPEVEELRQAVGRLRDAEKSVYFYLDGADDWTLYLASSGDRVIAAPTAALIANGLTLTASFFADGLEKIGVNPQFVRAGEYKTTPDSFERSDISKPHREVLESILEDTWQRYLDGTSEGFGLDSTQIEAALDQGIYDAEVAIEAGLIDAIAYPDELSSILEGYGHSPRIVHGYGERLFADRRWGRPPTIAIIPITGSIVLGPTPTGPFRGDVTGSTTVVEALNRAAEDPSIAAIILRIDSPGGEAHAADLIWRAAREADANKPVIASMSTLAASGGYYVAAGARHIVAAPSTITGSIGVFAGSVDLSGLLEKVGVGSVTLKRGELADLFGVDRPWSDEERMAVQSHVDSSYGKFIERVAESRDLSTAQVELVARGRTWTGSQAVRRNLVDEVGTFQDAVERAKEEANIAIDHVVDVTLYSGLKGPLAAFTGRGRPLTGGLLEETLAAPALTKLLESLGPFLWVQPAVPLAMLPCTVHLR